MISLWIPYKASIHFYDTNLLMPFGRLAEMKWIWHIQMRRTTYTNAISKYMISLATSEYSSCRVLWLIVLSNSESHQLKFRGKGWRYQLRSSHHGLVSYHTGFSHLIMHLSDWDDYFLISLSGMMMFTKRMKLWRREGSLVVIRYRQSFLQPK